jgi:transposase
MARFVVGDDRSQSTLFPERLDDYLADDNPVRAIDVFVDELELAGLGFSGVEPEATGRPAYHPATLLKIYVYGYLNRVQSSRRLERECQRNIELVWLTGRLMPDFKTIADFRKDNGEAIRRVCREFVVLCRRLWPQDRKMTTRRRSTGRADTKLKSWGGHTGLDRTRLTAGARRGPNQPSFEIPAGRAAGRTRPDRPPGRPPPSR